MSDFHREPTTQKARKEHQCIACGFKIPKGEVYTQQEGYHEDKAYRNRYHQECKQELDDNDICYFITGDVGPPERILKENNSE